GKRIIPKDGPEWPASDLAFAPDDRTIAQLAPYGKGAYLLWDTASREVTEMILSSSPSHANRAGLTPDGRLLLHKVPNENVVQLIDTRRREPIAKWATDENVVVHALSPDGQLAAATVSTNSDDPVTVYQTRTGEKAYRITRESRSLSLSVAFSPDSRQLFVGGDGIEVHDLDLRRKVASIGGRPPEKPKPPRNPLEPLPPIDLQRDRAQERERWKQLQKDGYYVRIEKLIVTADGKRLVS